MIRDTPNWTVSEGIGYGMLMAVAFNDQPTFDCLFAYYQLAAQGNPAGDGLMNWERDGCTATTPNAANPNYAATDADLDTAMALIMADCRWTGYTAKASAIVTAIKNNELASDNGVSMTKPGDNSLWGGPSCLNPSYFAPGYYRAFAQTYPADATTWNKLANDTYTLLNRMANSTTGLEPNWCTDQGAPSTCANNDDYAEYGWDALRTPWRVAVDYVGGGLLRRRRT